MIEERIIILRGWIRELENLTAMMLGIIEAPEENLEDLLHILEQRQQVIDRIKQLPPGEVQETIHRYDLGDELLRLDSQLKQKFKARYQDLREAIVALQQRKASMGLYRKKGAFAGGVFLDNKK